MIRTVVVDDEAFVPSGFRLILDAAEDIEAVAAVTGGKALAAVREHVSGVILPDSCESRMPDVDGLAVLAGVVMSPKATRSLSSGHPGTGGADKATARVERLSERVRDVLVLVAEGLSHVEIGGRSHLGSGTVKGHIGAFLTKLRVGGRVQAVLLAQRAGLSGQRVGLLGQWVGLLGQRAGLLGQWAGLLGQ